MPPQLLDLKMPAACRLTSQATHFKLTCAAALSSAVKVGLIALQSDGICLIATAGAAAATARCWRCLIPACCFTVKRAACLASRVQSATRERK